MKKTIILSAFFSLLSLSSFAQTPVIDVGVISTLVINHQAQQEVLKDIKSSESEIATAQKAIAIKMEQIRVLEEKVYKSLKDVSSVVKNAKDVVYASTVANDIGKYQAEMFQLAGEDPKLTVVAAKAELELVNRTADLLTYLGQALIGDTDANLLNNKQRLDMITHVVNELRIMRGIAYGICRKMRVAKRAGIYNTLNPLNMNYPDNGAAIVESLLDEF